MLNDMVGNAGVEIMTISRPAAYGEYAPYRFAHSEEELIALVKAMRDYDNLKTSAGRKNAFPSGAGFA